MARKKAASPWGMNELMVTAAFRYCCGRRTYITGVCADWLIEQWPQFAPATRALLEKELEEEFRRDDAARSTGADYKPLGADCDREQWERVRRLWAAPGGTAAGRATD